MEYINNMYLAYAIEMCKIWGCNISDLHTNDQGQSIARSIPDMTEIDQMIIGSAHPDDQKQKSKKSKKNSTPLLLLEMVS